MSQKHVEHVLLSIVFPIKYIISYYAYIHHMHIFCLKLCFSHVYLSILEFRYYPQPYRTTGSCWNRTDLVFAGHQISLCIVWLHHHKLLLLFYLGTAVRIFWSVSIFLTYISCKWNKNCIHIWKCLHVTGFQRMYVCISNSLLSKHVFKS